MSTRASIEEHTSPDESFYAARHLPVPDREWWPRDVAELCTLVEEAGEADLSRLVVGSGQHLRREALGERRFEVVRTRACDAIRELDLESGTVRVECGLTWGRLREALDDENVSLQSYRLHPSDATIGGLLARSHPAEREFRSGDLREGCIALSTTSPARAEYDYLPAPRKASGPDFRHLYIGGEGALGVILEATLVVRPTQPGRLLRWANLDWDEALAYRRRLEALDLEADWTHWRSDEGTLRVGIHAPPPLLEAHANCLRRTFDTRFAIEGDDAAEETRRRLEDDHPLVRSAPEAERIRAATWRLSDLSEALERLETELERFEFVDWGPHHASVACVMREESRDETWPDAVSEPALGSRRLVERRHATRVWPEWLQRVKAELDPDRGLAIGP